jgi:hypothetical protein
VTPLDVATRASSLYTREARGWAAAAAPWPVLELPLHPPTERAALDDLEAARAWVAGWRTAGEEWPLSVEWGVRNWARVGAQEVPVRVRVEGADAVVAVASRARQAVGGEWAVMRSRCVDLRASLMPLAGDATAVETALRRHAGAVAVLPTADFAVLAAVVVWLAKNPVSGRRVRSLPIRGIDTKWLERHRGLVKGLVSAVTGSSGLGLLGAPALVRMRVLDPALAVGGLRDVTAPVGEVAALELAPRVVLVTENLETLLELPDLDGVVAFHGAGYAVDSLAAIPWLRRARMLYWGDLDSQGFAILNRARAAGLEVASLLMDTETLLAYRDLWVREPVPFVGEPSRLTAAELATLAELRGHGGVRLEQERIPWGVAVAALRAAVSTPVD